MRETMHISDKFTVMMDVDMAHALQAWLRNDEKNERWNTAREIDATVNEDGDAPTC